MSPTRRRLHRRVSQLLIPESESEMVESASTFRLFTSLSARKRRISSKASLTIESPMTKTKGLSWVQIKLKRATGQSRSKPSCNFNRNAENNTHVHTNAWIEIGPGRNSRNRGEGRNRAVRCCRQQCRRRKVNIGDSTVLLEE